VQDRIAGRRRVHFGQIRKARLREIAVGQHRAFRAARRTRRIEQPGEIVAVARLDRNWIGGKQRVVCIAPDDDQSFETRRRVGRDLLIQPGRGEADPCAGMFEDVAELPAMQLGVRRHRREPAEPDAVNGLDVLDAILGDDRHAIARLEAECMQRAG
jgi:hypothetical protein